MHSRLKQTLFHVGRLDFGQNGDVFLAWKRDLIGGELLVTLKATLENFVDEISESPSSYLSALLVGDIVGFLSDWDGGLKENSG